MRIMRERLPGGWCARKTPRGAKSAPKGVRETEKTVVEVSLHHQSDEKRMPAATMRVSTVHFSTAC